MNAAVRVAAAALKGREPKSAKITPFVGKKKLKLGLPSLTKAFYGMPQLVSNLRLRAWNETTHIESLCTSSGMTVSAALSVFDNHVRAYFEDGKPIDQPRGH